MDIGSNNIITEVSLADENKNIRSIYEAKPPTKPIFSGTKFVYSPLSLI